MLKRTFLAMLSAVILCPSMASASDASAYLHFMNGLVLERKGSFDSALQEYKTTLMLDPQAVFVHKQALNLALHIGKVKDAEEWAQYIVNVDSTSSDNWVLYGNVQWAKGDADAARSAFERAMALDKENGEALYQLASLWSSKDQEKSIDYLKRYLALKPDEAPDVHYQIAILYNVKGNFEEMKKHLLLAKEGDSMYLQPRYMLANYYEVKNDTAAALNEYVELLSLEGKNIELLNHIGELYTSPVVSDLNEAEKYFLKVYELDKTNSSACFWLSVISEQRQDFAGAVSYLETSKDLKDNPGTVLRLSYYYTQMASHDKAIMLLENAHKKWPDNLEISYFLALGYDDHKRTPKAVELLKSVLAAKPDHTEARLQYAVIAEREGDMAAAEENFRYLLSKNPQNANILNYLGYALADRGMKLSEAEDMISRAIKEEPLNGAYLDSLAWVHFKQGKYDQARAEIRSALGVIHDDGILWDHAGDIYAALGDLKNAWRAYNIALLMERTDKRKALPAKIKSVEKKLPAAEAQNLVPALLKTFSLNGKEFSAFAKVQALFKGKKIKMDAVLRFSPPDDFSLILVGPLMAPVWKIKLSGTAVGMDAVSLKDVDETAFSYWAAIMAGELKDYFSGAMLNGKGVNVDGWGADSLTTGAREIYLNADRNMIDRVVPRKENKMQVKFSDYFFKNMCLVAQTMEFKIPFFTLKIVLNRDQINLKDSNILKME